MKKEKQAENAGFTVDGSCEYLRRSGIMEIGKNIQKLNRNMVRFREADFCDE